jgi:hypothetical protein
MEVVFNTYGNEKQKDVARLWVDNTTTDIVYGGSKGSGKSYLGASLIFGDSFLYPETSYFIARKSLTNIRKFTIPSIHEVFQHWGISNQMWKYNGQDNFYELNNKSRVYLLDAKYIPSDPLYYRFGSMQMTRGWIEEAGEFEEAAKNNLAASIGRWKNDVYNLTPKLLQTCNPSKNYLYREYYKMSKANSLPEWRKYIQALPTDNHRLPDGYLKNLERTLSVNEKQRLLHGNWEYDDDPSALCDYEKILDCFTNNHVPGGGKFITADIARLGGDKIVIIEWDGWRGKIKHYSKQTLDVTSTYIQAAMSRNETGRSSTLLDSDGLGGGPVDFLKVKGFVNNARPLSPPERPANDTPENYDNLKSQCYFRLAERINKNGLYLECETEQIKQWIIEELEQVKQKSLDSDMRKGVIPKDKIKEVLGRSPDFSDAIMMREYFDLKPIKTLTWA